MRVSCDERLNVNKLLKVDLCKLVKDKNKFEIFAFQKIEIM